MANSNRTKPSFVPWTEADTSLGPGGKFPFFITDAVAACKGNVFIWKAPGRDGMGRAELVGRPHFSNPAFYTELFKGKPYQAAFQLGVIHLLKVIQ